MEIGAKLRQARIAAGLTQEQTAEALGVSRQSISNWENEKNYPDIVSVVRLSDLYAVSLDALLKEEAPMSDYLDYLEESTNTVRSRREQSLLILLCVYLGIWAVSVLFFWLLTGPDDAMGYGIVFLWLVLPVAAFVISLLIGRGGYGGRQGWLLPLVFGTMYMLAEYATFMLANMLFKQLPTSTKICTASLALLPEVQERSARDLGAGRLAVLRDVVFPALRPAFLSCFVYNFTSSMTTAGSIIFLIDAKRQLAVFKLFDAVYQGDYALASLIASVITVIVLLVEGLAFLITRKGENRRVSRT